MCFNIIIYSIRDITTIKIKWSINGIVCYNFATWNSSKVMSIISLIIQKKKKKTREY